MRGRLIHTIVGVAAVLGCFACALFAFALLRLSPAFEKGTGYEFYLGANSSSLMVKSDCPAWDKLRLGRVAGEKTEYENAEREQIESKFHARLLFTEEACGVVNYYYYSPDLGACVYVNGYCVNLHIAVSQSRTAVGTPLIFGGY